MVLLQLIATYRDSRHRRSGRVCACVFVHACEGRGGRGESCAHAHVCVRARVHVHVHVHVHAHIHVHVGGCEYVRACL